MSESASSLKPGELVRWIWRQLTSMRTALVLLLLLALGAVPGSVVPQENVDAFAASQWQQQHPKLAPIYDSLGLFSVYDSVWFSAIYLLLMVSLVGCILPRTAVYWKALRAQPPKPPRRFSRMPGHTSFETTDSADAVLAKARSALKGYRLLDGDGSISAERGKMREAGNLLFHVCVVVVLVGFAFGNLFGFKGGVIVITGNGFSNALSQYDDFRPGGFFDADELAPFSFTVDGFDVTFIEEGREAGMAHKFAADLTYRTSPSAEPKKAQISVNHPLNIDGTKVFLISHGYAPHITVRDGRGQVAYDGPVVFLPEDSSFRSFGVIKVPDAQSKDGSAEQLGFEGEFYPTYAFTKETGPFSAFPDAKNPALSMLAYRGDLGIDSGAPQSVYALQKKGLKPIKKADGKPLRLDIAMGRTIQLPDGLGSITFDGVSRYVKLQVSRSPYDEVALGGVSLALVGLLGSLFIRPRRIWVRVRSVDGGATLVEIAGLDRTAGGDLAAEIRRIEDAIAGNGVEKA